MKKSIILVLLFVCSILVPPSLAVSSTIPTDAPDIDITLLNHEPDPVGPGELVELRLKLENNGQGVVEDVYVDIDPEFPFYLRPGDSGSKFIGDVTSYQKNDKAYTFDFTLITENSAIDGRYEVDVYYRGSTVSGKDKVNVTVRARDANVGIHSIATNPQKLVPGSQGMISVDVRNYGASIVKDITLKLDFSSSTLPIAPIGTSSEQKVERLNAGEGKLFNYKVIPFPDASSQIYKVPVVLTYFDTSGLKYNKTDVIAIIVGAEPELKVTIDDTEVYKADSNGEVTFRISNKGVTDVKFLTATITDKSSKDNKTNSKKFVVIGSNSKYVGGVDSDDFELVKFDIYVEKGAKQAIIPLKLDYRDDNNEIYEENVEITLPLYSGSDLNKFGIEKSSPIGIILSVLVVGAAAYWYFMRRKKK